MRLTDALRRQATLQDEVLSRQAETSLGAFVRQAWPILEPSTPLQSNWHIELIVEYLEHITAGNITRLVINVPPRCMKSLLVSVFWPVWEWLGVPSRRFIVTSYAETLALKHSLDRRTIIESPWYQSRWGRQVTLAGDQNLKNEFQNTARGVMIATSTGGSITGKGGSRIIVDDPHNPGQAESDAQREAARDYFRRTLSTRLDDKKHDAIVVVMQRLHEHDLTALCLEFGFDHLCIPAVADSPTQYVFPRTGRVLDRPVGDVLWPARDDADVLAGQQRLLGSAAYASQYQQRPAPATGVMFNPRWLRYYDELPANVSIMQSWDCAFKDKAENDYVVGLVAGQHGADIYVMDRAKGHWSFAETCRQVVRLHQKYPTTRAVLVEDAANGPAVVDMLRHHVPGLIPVQPQGGKLARAQAVQPRVEAGNVYLPDPAPRGVRRPDREWVEDFVHQLTVFPRGRHDDDVDAFTQLAVRCQPRRKVSPVWGRD